jgi:TIR domain
LSYKKSAAVAKDFFISYTGVDRERAKWIAWQLKEAGYSVILQAWDFRPGDNFILRIDEACKEAERTIAVLSPDYLRSTFTRPEWAAALYNDPLGMVGKLLPIHVRECRKELGGLLGPIVYIDLVGVNEDEARQRLLYGVKRGRQMPKTPPQFPKP